MGSFDLRRNWYRIILLHCAPESFMVISQLKGGHNHEQSLL